MPLDFNKLLHHPISSGSSYHPKTSMNRPNPSSQASGDLTEALTPGLAALVDRRFRPSEQTLHNNTIAPHLLLANPSRSQDTRPELRNQHSTSNQAFSADHFTPISSNSSVTEGFSDVDHAASADDSVPSISGHQRSSRRLQRNLFEPGLANSVDLTCNEETSHENMSRSGSQRKRNPDIESESGPSSASKRRKTSVVSHRHTGGPERTKSIVEVDLLDDEDDNDQFSKTLQSQRADQIQAQQGQADLPTKLGTLKCTVCLDKPKDLTVTNCGMLL